MLRIAVTGILICAWASLANAQITFVIESLPAATPGADTLFITGTFNDWVPNDPRYAVRRQLNGQLSVIVPEQAGKMEYKFTRGSWTKVETSVANAYTRNREWKTGKSKKIFVQIDNWLDLGGARPLNYTVFYFFACALQSIALSLIASRIPRRNRLKFKPLLILNLWVTVLLIMLVIRETANPVWQSYFAFVYHVSLFCWGPVLLSFIHSFHTGKPLPGVLLYFIPAGAALAFVTLRLGEIEGLAFLSDVVRPPLAIANALIVGTGVLFNLFIYARIFRRFSFLSTARMRPAGTQMLFYFYWISLAALVVVPLNTVLLVVGVHYPFVEDFLPVSVGLSALIFTEAYFLWRYPEIIKEEKPSPAPTGESSTLARKVNAFMISERPYRNADLSVSELADLLDTKPHILSKVINDGYHKNFRDFVNCYRIEEFIRLANTREFRHYTFLALAQEVGFNSKSTFNLAFKKFTHQSPREYFKSKGTDITHTAI